MPLCLEKHLSSIGAYLGCWYAYRNVFPYKHCTQWLDSYHRLLKTIEPKIIRSINLRVSLRYQWGEEIGRGKGGEKRCRMEKRRGGLKVKKWKKEVKGRKETELGRNCGRG